MHTKYRKAENSRVICSITFKHHYRQCILSNKQYVLCKLRWDNYIKGECWSCCVLLCWSIFTSSTKYFSCHATMARLELIVHIRCKKPNLFTLFLHSVFFFNFFYFLKMLNTGWSINSDVVLNVQCSLKEHNQIQGKQIVCIYEEYIFMIRRLSAIWVLYIAEQGN